MDDQQTSRRVPEQTEPQITVTMPGQRALPWRKLAALLIVVGLGVIALYGLRSFRAYREFQYIRAEGLDRGAARVEAIRPWMTVRYVGVAYAVPVEFIFAQLDIPYNRRNVNETLK